jgi:hypothetical protein
MIVNCLVSYIAPRLLAVSCGHGHILHVHATDAYLASHLKHAVEGAPTKRKVRSGIILFPGNPRILQLCQFVRTGTPEKAGYSVLSTGVRRRWSLYRRPRRSRLPLSTGMKIPRRWAAEEAGWWPELLFRRRRRGRDCRSPLPILGGTVEMWPRPDDSK